MISSTSPSRPATVVSGGYYVHASVGSSLHLLAGPFPDEVRARRWLDPAQDLLLARGELELAIGARVGRLIIRPQQVRRGDLNGPLAVPEFADWA